MPAMARLSMDRKLYLGGVGNVGPHLSTDLYNLCRQKRGRANCPRDNVTDSPPLQRAQGWGNLSIAGNGRVGQPPRVNSKGPPQTGTASKQSRRALLLVGKLVVKNLGVCYLQERPPAFLVGMAGKANNLAMIVVKVLDWHLGKIEILNK